MDKSRRVLGEEHPNRATYINNMGGLLEAQGKFSEAEPYYRQALEKNRRGRGEEHPLTLTFTANVGRVLQLQGKHEEAINLLVQVEPSARKAFIGNDARRLAGLLSTLGLARYTLGFDAERFALAEANLLEAHPIFVAAKDRGPTHKDTLQCVQGLVDLYTAWHTAKPGDGYDVKAEEWRQRLPPP